MKGKTQKKMEREIERDLQPLGVRRWRELVADRKKMEGHFSTGQSPQWAVVLMEEGEEEEEEEGEEEEKKKKEKKKRRRRRRRRRWRRRMYVLVLDFNSLALHER